MPVYVYNRATSKSTGFQIFTLEDGQYVLGGLPVLTLIIYHCTPSTITVPVTDNAFL